ncbi:hypothetical protein [Francisella philomiragia]|uniref:hypothetical protein n=1 Tax=Francisella philomiragia TaxID=28110 RepID=UPI001B8CD39E|nr:hypothetical protein [Francisella philomiragia]QUE32428.1 hypothetical protein IMS64_09550 [Francisella philomiragia]
MKELNIINQAITETRELFNDLNTIRDRSKLLKMQEKTMAIMNCLMDLKEEIATIDNRLVKLEKIKKILEQ